MGLAGVICVWAMTAIASERAKSVYNDLLGDPDGRLAKTPGSDLNMVTPDIRDEVILYLRRYASGTDAFSGNKTGLSHNSSAIRLLIRLGDEQQIEEHLKDVDATFAKFGGYSLGAIIYDGEVAHPLLIPRLAKHFFAEDGDNPWEHRVDDSWNLVYPKSIGCAVSTLGMMRNLPAFSSELRSWADKTYQRVRHAAYKMGPRLPDHLIPYPDAEDIDLTELRKAMREWWKENAGSFAVRDYASVKPGAWLPATKAPAAAESAKGTTDSPASRAEITHPVGIASEPVPPASSSSPLIYPLAIGSSLLLLASIAFFLRRKKSG